MRQDEKGPSERIARAGDGIRAAPGSRGPRRRLQPLPRRDPAARAAVDWWVRVVPFVLGLHVALLLTLRARPGHVGLWIWYAGPIVLAVVTAALLVGSLMSARRWKHGVNRWHVLGYIGLVAVIFTLPTFGVYPSSHDERPSQVRFRLPLDVAATVAWGGSTAAVNYHVFLPDQRWAYDLLVTRDGRSHQADGAELEDYYGYGLPVYAPAAGVIFASQDGAPDVKIGTPRWGLSGLGNHIGIEVAPDQYLFIGHLLPGSVTLNVGDRVVAGQLLGRVGNSGNSSEPHVHLHLQDSTRVYFGEGIPFYFHQYAYAGRIIERGMPEGGQRGGRYVGQRVRPATTSATVP